MPDSLGVAIDLKVIPTKTGLIPKEVGDVEAVLVQAAEALIPVLEDKTWKSIMPPWENLSPLAAHSVFRASTNFSWIFSFLSSSRVQRTCPVQRTWILFL